MAFPLPSSYKNWNEIQQKLKYLQDHPNWSNLEHLILHFANQTKKVSGHWETRETTSFPEEFEYTLQIKELPCLKSIGEKTEKFYSEFIPKLVQLSLELPKLFPDSKLKILKANSEDRVELTRKQVKLDGKKIRNWIVK